MGLIREPKNVDFYVEDRPLTEEEKQLLKAAIAKNKAAVQAKRSRAARPKVRAKSKPRTKAKVTR
jgi:hypothetical protein